MSSQSGSDQPPPDSEVDWETYRVDDVFGDAICGTCQGQVKLVHATKKVGKLIESGVTIGGPYARYMDGYFCDQHAEEIVKGKR